MRDLMVGREARLEGVTITTLYADPDTLTIHYQYAADHGAWFSPSDPLSGPDGWIRGLERIEGEGSFECAEREQFDRYYRLMGGWAAYGTELRLGSDLNTQCTALWEPGTVPLLTVSVRMDDALLDRAA